MLDTPTLGSSMGLYSMCIDVICFTYIDEIVPPTQTGPCAAVHTQHKYWHEIQRIQKYHRSKFN